MCVKPHTKPSPEFSFPTLDILLLYNADNNKCSTFVYVLLLTNILRSAKIEP